MDYTQKISDHLFTELSYSYRRFYVDKFFLDIALKIPKNARILDMGGKKKNKRGLFNIENYNFEVQYANIDKSTNPDFECDISSIPVEDESFDCAILAEVIEHLPEPIKALNEAFRILKPGGVLLMSIPFIFHIHADPYDYARYTEYWYNENLLKIGYKNICVEKQGLFFSVLANMLKHWANELNKSQKPKSVIKKRLFHSFILWFCKNSFKWDKSDFVKNNWLLSGYTIGYGISCIKPIHNNSKKHF